jgi:hypothetical protein
MKNFNIFENHLISVKTNKVLQYLPMTIYMPFTLTTLMARYLFWKGGLGGGGGGRRGFTKKGDVW